MEIAIKYRIGKLPDAALLAQDFEAIVAGQGFTELAITVRHARLAGEMKITHRDPFDRLLIAQAQAENMILGPVPEFRTEAAKARFERDSRREEEAYSKYVDDEQRRRPPKPAESADAERI